MLLSKQILFYLQVHITVYSSNKLLSRRRTFERAFSNLADQGKHFSCNILKYFSKISVLAVGDLIINERHAKLAPSFTFFLSFYCYEKICYISIFYLLLILKSTVKDLFKRKNFKNRKWCSNVSEKKLLFMYLNIFVIIVSSNGSLLQLYIYLSFRL